MISKLDKVDRVRSAEEAVGVESLGAGMVGVTLSPDPRFDDDRTLTVEQAALVGKALRRATLVATIELTDEPTEILRMVAASGAGVVQPIRGNTVPPPSVRTALSDAGIGIVYGGIEIAHDEDPSWIFSAFTDTPELGAVLFQADVLPEFDGSWAFLRDQSPEYPEEFQIADLDMLGQGVSARRRAGLHARQPERDRRGSSRGARNRHHPRRPGSARRPAFPPVRRGDPHPGGV